MKNLIVIMVVILMTVGLVACSSAPKVGTAKPIEPAPQPSEKLIWSSNSQRPGWTVSEPEKQEGKLLFIGLSGKFATEKEGRDDAHRSAINNVVRYIGTFAKDKFERITTTYGLSSEIIDPTRATRDFEQQLSDAFATHVKAKEWYIEKWENPKFKEAYYLVYVLCGVPENVIEKSYEDALNGKIDDLKKKRDAANEEKAKAQFDNAMKAFEDAKKQGFDIEKK